MFKRLHFASVFNNVKNLSVLKTLAQRNHIFNARIDAIISAMNCRNFGISHALQRCALSTTDTKSARIKANMSVFLERNSNGKFMEHATIKWSHIWKNEPQNPLVENKEILPFKTTSALMDQIKKCNVKNVSYSPGKMTNSQLDESIKEQAKSTAHDVIEHQVEKINQPNRKKTHKKLNQLNRDYKRNEITDILKPFFMKAELNAKPISNRANCITIVGSNDLSRAISALLVQKKLTRELVLFDRNKEVIEEDAMDLLSDNGTYIHASTSVSETMNSNYIIFAVESEPKTKTQVSPFGIKAVQRTGNMLKSIVPKIVSANRGANYIVLSRPMELMTWLTQKIGHLSSRQCLTIGCHLDTTRFIHYISRRLNVSTKSVNGYIIGCSGAHSIPAWSSVVVGSMPLRVLKPDIGTEFDNENWYEIHHKIAHGVVQRKGYCSGILALAAIDIIEALVNDSKRILTVGANVNGLNGIEDDVVLSLPCVLTKKGVSKVLELPLSSWEKMRLHRSVATQLAAQDLFKL